MEEVLEQVTILDGLVGVLTLLIAIVGFFVSNTLRQIQGSIQQIELTMSDLGKRFTRLEAEHELIVKKNAHIVQFVESGGSQK